MLSMGLTRNFHGKKGGPDFFFFFFCGLKEGPHAFINLAFKESKQTSIN